MATRNDSEIVTIEDLAPLHRVASPSIADTFRTVVQSVPDAPAVRCGSEELSYSGLAAEVDRVAGALRGWPPDRRVAVVEGAPSISLIAAVLAVLTSDRVLALVDPSLPADRRTRIELLLGIGTDAEALSGSDVRVVAGSAAVSGRLDRDTSHLFFSSGTTGTPKPVLGSRTLLHEFLHWERRALGIGPGDRVAMTTAVSFDVVLRDILLPLTAGATLILPASPVAPDDMLAWLSECDVSVLHAVPTLAALWLAAAPPQIANLAVLRATLFAGEPLLPDLVRSWRRAATESQVWNLYGPTETVLAKAAYLVPEPVPEVSVLPVGRSIPGAEMIVVDDGRKPCPAAVAGEIAIRFKATSFGYLGEPDATGERFVTIADGSALFLTGDRGRVTADGTVEFLGRRDNVVKVRGVRIDLDEVASMLTSHDNVVSACVVTVGAGTDQLLVGHVGKAAGVDADGLARRLVEFLRTRLPAPMVPNTIVVHDRLPVTRHGKTDRAALRDHVPDPAGFAAPVTSEEEHLSRIWAEVLVVRRVGRTDDFFELGGHSLNAARMLSLVRKQLGAQVALTTLFEHPQLHEFAQAVHVAGGPRTNRP